MEWKQITKTDEKKIIVPERWIYPFYYEAFNLLFRIENAIRVFVYIVLKNELKENWMTAQVTGDDQDGTIDSIAKRRMSQSQNFGYLGYPIQCPIMHLTSGEMTRLIVSEAYWKLFKPYFLGNKDIIKNKLDEIGNVRNSLAHFRPIKPDDVDAIKQNSKHVLLGIEDFLKQVLIQGDVIPTNTEEDWYKNLKTLGTDNCTFSFLQSKNEDWVRIIIQYKCPILRKIAYWPNHTSYNVLNLKSTSVLTEYQIIRKNVTYLTESVSYPTMLEDRNADFQKNLNLVFARKVIKDNHSELKKQIEELILCVSRETDLIKQDNLARGKIVHSANTSASLQEQGDRKYWTFNTNSLLTSVQENDPPEYWGNLSFSEWDDFIAGTNQYPWMPQSVSEYEIPF